MSLSTSYWVEPLWKVLYSIANGFPEEPTKEYQEYANTMYATMAQLLPDQDYRHHYHTFLGDNPIKDATGSREDLLKWLHSLHNAINEQLQLQPVTLEEQLIGTNSISPPPVRKRTVPLTTGRHTGTVSYGIRRTSIVEHRGAGIRRTTAPTATVEPQTATQPKVRKRSSRRQQVSYGMRRAPNLQDMIQQQSQPPPEPQPQPEPQTTKLNQLTPYDVLSSACSPPPPRPPRKTRQTVSFGMRRSVKH